MIHKTGKCVSGKAVTRSKTIYLWPYGLVCQQNIFAPITPNSSASIVAHLNFVIPLSISWHTSRHLFVLICGRNRSAAHAQYVKRGLVLDNAIRVDQQSWRIDLIDIMYIWHQVSIISISITQIMLRFLREYYRAKNQIQLHYVFQYHSLLPNRSE
jgi:hypothetical protein